MAGTEEIRDTRLAKLKKLKQQGVNPFPIDSHQTHTIRKLSKDFGKIQETRKEVVIDGRVMSLRGQGGLVFTDINDGTGTFQCLIKKDDIEGDKFELWSEAVDIGDIVEVTGTLFVTNRGANTLAVTDWTMLAKSLRQLPGKWHGLKDVDERFRKRYLDLISSPEVKDRFLKRTRIVTELRKILDKNDFIEVETPILQSVAGGASAEPFVTHHNALDIDLYLRIAPELYLKYLLIGGLPKVYEIGRLFRNEGIDVTHNPEFTTVEWYESYSDAKKQRKFVEKTIRTIVKNVMGDTKVEFGDEVIDFGKKFEVVKFFDLLKQYALLVNPHKMSREELRLKATQLGVSVDDGDGVEKILDSIYKKTCRPKLIDPTFIVDYPVNYLPLAKRKKEGGKIVDAFQIVAGGLEIVKAFSELNDPIDQVERFKMQQKMKEDGDAEAQPMDEEFIEAMEHGMPPAGGLAISIDRLTMLLTNTKNIREVILFPTLRPKG